MKFLTLSFVCLLFVFELYAADLNLPAIMNRAAIETTSGFASPIYTAASSMKLHEARSSSSNVLTEIPRGAEVKVLDSRFGNWWQVQYKTKTGYAQRSYLKYSTANDLSDYDPIYNFSSPYNSKPGYVLQAEQELYEHRSSTSAIVTRLPKGTEVKVIDSTDDSWWLVHYKGRTGHIRSSGLSSSGDGPQQGPVVPVKKLSLVPKAKPTHTTTSSLSMRESMSNNAAVLFQIPTGAPVVVVNPDFNHWAQIEFAGRTGYVPSGNFAALSDTGTDEPLAAADPASLEGSGKAATSASRLENDAITETDTALRAKGATANTSTHTLTAETSLRASPDAQARVLSRFAAGDQVTVLDDSGEWWWEVTFKGKRGWVKRRLLSSKQ